MTLEDVKPGQEVWRLYRSPSTGMQHQEWCRVVRLTCKRVLVCDASNRTRYVDPKKLRPVN